MRFFKQNSYDIVKLYINNIGITIFSFMIHSAIAMAEGGLVFQVLTSVFSILFLCVLVYCAAWDMGAKDRLLIDAGRLSADKFKGIKLGLFANAPNFLITVLAIISLGLHMLTGAEWLYTVFAVFNLIMRLLMSMYLGVTKGVFQGLADETELYFLLQSFGFLLLPLFMVASCAIGYTFGTRNFRIFGQSTKNKE